jgi:hypothetical protein
MSTTPRIDWSNGSRTTLAEHDHFLMPKQKCSVAWTWIGRPVWSAVPMAFVPQVNSLQSAPGRRWICSVAF